MSTKIPEDAYVIIIGAMKCGTSSLYSYMKDHPQICPAIDKEPEFFSENQGHGVDVEHYDDLWSFDGSVHRYALEASTGYTKYPSEPNVPKNMHDYGIQPKLIYVIRNPHDRIISHFNYMVQRDASWKLEIDDKHLISTSDYFLQLERFREYFPVESILVLDFDDLKSKPEAVLRSVYNFLGLEPVYIPDDFAVVNPTHVESALERKMKMSKVGTLVDAIPGPIRRAGKRLVRAVSPPAKRKLTDSERQLVHEKLSAGMVNLHRVYGFDVKKWGFDV